MGSGSAGTSSQIVFERAGSHAHKPSRLYPEAPRGLQKLARMVGSGIRQTHQLTLKVRQPMLEMMSLRR